MLAGFRIVAVFLGLISIFSPLNQLFAQTNSKQGECALDELDMGDYCASLPSAKTQSEKDTRRITRFRGTSMMPGRTGEISPGSGPAEEPGQTLAADPGIAGEGFNLQLGAFSTREVAESVAHSVKSPGPPITVVPVESGERIL